MSTAVNLKCSQWTSLNLNIFAMFSQKMELLSSRFKREFIHHMTFYLLLCCTFLFLRLKLIPDERRSQQSSTLYGAGTIMVDQEFLFHVIFLTHYSIFSVYLIIFLLQGSLIWAWESHSKRCCPNLQRRKEKKCLLV